MILQESRTMTYHESDGFTSEENKSNRNGNANALTKRRKKTLRTPPRKTDDKLYNITVMMEQIMLEVQEIRKHQDEYQQEITRIKEENDEWKKENKKLKLEVGQKQYCNKKV